jgi:hypothetical protein
MFSGTILGFIVSNEDKVMDPNKVEALINMLVPITPHEIQVLKGILKVFHQKLCFHHVTYHVKLLKKTRIFEWTEKCQNAWEEIKNQYIQALILISPN